MEDREDFDPLPLNNSILISHLFCLTKQVTIRTGLKNSVANVEWQASSAGDVIADSVVALLMHVQSSAASICLTSFIHICCIVTHG
jgi:hypothetical protein